LSLQLCRRLRTLLLLHFGGKADDEAVQPRQESWQAARARQSRAPDARARQVRARGVEAMVAAMARLRGHAMVQLSALLAFIPLALENAALQAHVAALALREVLAAMAAHRRVANVQAKGLIVLGVLGQARRRALDALGPHCPRTLCG